MELQELSTKAAVLVLAVLCAPIVWLIVQIWIHA